jgi:CRP/FNR family nitrogen fixation transcriptional regulator
LPAPPCDDSPEPAQAGRSAPAFIGPVLSFPRNAEIYGENEAADYVYRIVSGTVRTCKILADGRRQVGAFYFRGELLGLETGPSHGFSAETVTECRLAAIKRGTLEALARDDRTLAQQLWQLTARELQRTQRHLLRLITTAQERVAGFLLEMAERTTGNDVIDLPMSRPDIADHLGLTVETISRTLRALEHASLIEMPSSRRFRLPDPAALRRLNA